MDGIRKTALFLSGLEWKTVDLLLGRLDPESARAVRREMMSLGSVRGDEVNALAGEFLHAAGAHPPKSARSKPVDSARTTYSVSRYRTAPTTEVPKPSRPFDFLRNERAETICREIAEEHPQTVAIVLAHLPASQAGEVLGGLGSSLQIEVARRLSNFEAGFDQADPLLLEEIEQTLRKRFENRDRSQHRRTRGAAVMKRILQSTDPNTQARILADLEHYEDEPVDRSPSFDDLRRLGNADLSTLFHSVDANTAMMALIGAPPDLIERVTARFSPTEEHGMRLQLKRLNSVTRQDVERARKAILDKAELILSEKE